MKGVLSQIEFLVIQRKYPEITRKEIPRNHSKGCNSLKEDFSEADVSLNHKNRALFGTGAKNGGKSTKTKQSK